MPLTTTATDPLDELAAEPPRRRVLAVSAYRPESARIGVVEEELRASRHDVRLELMPTESAGTVQIRRLHVLAASLYTLRMDA